MRVLLFLAFTLMLTTIAEARNEYLNNSSQACRYGDVSASIQAEDRNTDYRQPAFPNNNYDSDGDNYRLELRISKFLGVSKSDCDRQNKIMLENEELKQQLELLKVCNKYADRPLPPQFATVAEKCKGMKSRSNNRRNTAETKDPLWDQMKQKYLQENPDKLTYDTTKKNLMIPKDITGPLPIPTPNK